MRKHVATSHGNCVLPVSMVTVHCVLPVSMVTVHCVLPVEEVTHVPMNFPCEQVKLLKEFGTGDFGKVRNTATIGDTGNQLVLAGVSS